MPIETYDPEIRASITLDGRAPAGARLVSRAASCIYTIPDGSAVIGSSESADVRDSHDSVQPHHARIVREAGLWYVEDLNSTSGTFLNGRRIDGRELVVHGDAVRCGTSPVELVCELAERKPGTDSVDDVESRIEMAQAWIQILEERCAARDAQIEELGARIKDLDARLRLVSEALAHACEDHEDELAAVQHELENQLREERHELAVESELHDVALAQAVEAQSSIPDLRKVINAQQKHIIRQRKLLSDAQARIASLQQTIDAQHKSSEARS